MKEVSTLNKLKHLVDSKDRQNSYYLEDLSIYVSFVLLVLICLRIFLLDRTPPLPVRRHHQIAGSGRDP